MAGHHLILGELNDYITSETLPDTHDERYRQKIARFLVEEKGFAPEEIHPRQPLTINAGDRSAVIRIDFLVRIVNRVCMIIKYGPGSLLTRHRPAVALSRLAVPYQIPVVVVTNGEDADILDGRTASRIGTGFENIPEKSKWVNDIPLIDFIAVDPKRAQMEARIVFAYEVDDSCPCDDTICRLS